MTKIIFTRIQIFLVLFLLYNCGSKTATSLLSSETQSESSEASARQAFDAYWDNFNNLDLSDSLNYNKNLDFFADDYLQIGKEGKPPGNGKGTFKWLGDYVQTHKPKFDITVDNVDASKDMAYFLYRYQETFTNV